MDRHINSRGLYSTCYTHLSRAVPIFHVLYPYFICCTHLPRAVPIFHVLYPSSTCCTHLPRAIPIFHVLYPSSTCYTHLPRAVPIFHVLYPSSTCCTHISYAVCDVGIQLKSFLLTCLLCNLDLFDKVSKEMCVLLARSLVKCLLEWSREKDMLRQVCYRCCMPLGKL